MAEQAHTTRAGFWRRALAFAVDCVIITLLLQAVAVVAFPLTGGRVQSLTGAIGMQQDCSALTVPPPGVVVTAFEPNYIESCRHSFLGRPVGQSVEIGRRTTTTSGTTDGSITIAVDQNGRPSGILALDWLIIPLTLLFRWRRDRYGTTPGRWLTRIHVEAHDTKERPAPGLTKRYGLFALPFIPLLPLQIWPLGLLNMAGVTPFLYAASALAVAELVILLMIVVPIVRRRDAFYDKCADTVVVRDNSPALKA
jgi:uncharacterized RDD family membrane protein YckC